VADDLSLGRAIADYDGRLPRLPNARTVLMHEQSDPARSRAPAGEPQGQDGVTWRGAWYSFADAERASRDLYAAVRTCSGFDGTE
jgi:hypothetical protein